ncbi:MAG: hypothetical protein J1E36_08780 [Eubacterium sp.]|nr:hypothetical protein [Eubacterium sp.]
MKKQDKPKLKVEHIGSPQEALQSLSESEREAFFSTILKRIYELKAESENKDKPK